LIRAVTYDDADCQANKFALSASAVGHWRWWASDPTACWQTEQSIAAVASANGSVDAQPELPAGYTDMWARIRAGFSLPRIAGPLVAKYRALYTRHPQHVTRILERSQRYLYFIVAELEKRNMPNEIALLPIIESAYNPRAQSPMRAAGLWQFIPSTGRHYGLHRDSWYDGRRDVLAATRAALDYLQFLHGMFGDWELALAAYNWGEYAVQRAIARNVADRKPTRYQNLKMPTETRGYLPKLQAVKDIIDNHKLFGIELPHVPNKPYFIAINTAADIDVMKAAQLADVSVEEFQLLNAGYAGPVVIPTAERQIVLPVDKVEGFQARLENYNEPLSTWQMYTLKKGDSLQKLARRFSTSVSSLRDANGFLGRARARPGQVLLVPIAQRQPVVRTAAILPTSIAPARPTEQRNHAISEAQAQGRLLD
jgi:membrane-bound lytic murein transglycosylase D